MSAQVKAYDFVVEGIYYTRVATSSGGICDGNVEVSAAPNGYSGFIDIPATISANGGTWFVTGIYNSAFSGCSELTAVRLPYSIKTIGAYAFENCTSLRYITFPDGVNQIVVGAFDGCTALDTAFFNSEDPCLFVFGNPFENANPNLAILVPCGAGDAYANHEDWAGQELHIFENCGGNIEPVGIATVDGIAPLAVYPNPATNRVIVEASEVTVYDLMGKPVRHASGSEERHVLDLQGLPSGIYMVRSRNSVQRLVIE